jgi:hypothetical protein
MRLLLKGLGKAWDLASSDPSVNSLLGSTRMRQPKSLMYLKWELLMVQ